MRENFNHKKTSKMENYHEILLALIPIAALILLSRVIFKSPSQLQKLPPGPKPWPIIGNINLLRGSSPHKSLHSLSQKYGEIMLIRLGKFPVVVASSPHMAKQFLKVHDANFASRPTLAAGKYTAYNYSDMTWAPYGSYWRQARKIYLSEVFNAKKLEFFKPLRVEEERSFLSRLYSQSGRPVVLREHLSHFMLSNISRIVFSNNYFCETKNDHDKAIFRLDELQRMLEEWFFLNGVINIGGDWIPWPRFLDVQGYVKKMKDLDKKLDRIYEFVIDDHQARRRAAEKDFASKDVIDSLLLMVENHNLEVKLSRDSIKAFLQSWRLHPLAPLLVPHCAIEDCLVEGYDIPKGTTVFINTWSLGRDPNSWDAPEEFLPERFLGKDIDVTGGNFALLPFGSGRRRCPGYKLGLKIVRTTLANLLHGFEMRLVEGMRPQDICVEEIYGLTIHPKESLKLIMEPTLPPHLY